MREPEHLMLAADPSVPNNRWPALIYRGAGPPDAAAMLELFGRHGWSNGWRNGIYPFHHFHATTHEVLGITRGVTTVRLGGESGGDVTLQPGDVVVLPAGTGHKRLATEGSLEVVGAYPGGCDWDLVRAEEVTPALYARLRDVIATVPVPDTDPVLGGSGALRRIWAGPNEP